MHLQRDDPALVTCREIAKEFDSLREKQMQAPATGRQQQQQQEHDGFHLYCEDFKHDLEPWPGARSKNMDTTHKGKFEPILLMLRLGVTTMWVDADTWFLKDPTPHLQELLKANDVDILTTEHFSASSINNGIALMKSNERTLRWYLAYLRWTFYYAFGQDQNGWETHLCSSSPVNFLGYEPCND